MNRTALLLAAAGVLAVPLTAGPALAGASSGTCNAPLGRVMLSPYLVGHVSAASQHRDARWPYLVTKINAYGSLYAGDPHPLDGVRLYRVGVTLAHSNGVIFGNLVGTNAVNVTAKWTPGDRITATYRWDVSYGLDTACRRTITVE